MLCQICGKEGAQTRRVTRSYGKGDNLLIIENIPMISCPNCGESFFTAETLHEVERIKQNRDSLATTKQVAFAEFA
jgi:YgiT-type zinc finger domain-containing protein